MSIRMSLGYRRVSIALAWWGKTASGHGLGWEACTQQGPAGFCVRLATKRKARGNNAAGCKNIRSRASVPTRMSVFREGQVMSMSCMAQFQLADDAHRTILGRRVVGVVHLVVYPAMEFERARRPGRTQLQGRCAANTAVAACTDRAGAVVRHVDAHIETGTERYVGQHRAAARGRLVEVGPEAHGDLALVPEHLDGWVVVVFDVHLGNHHFLRKVHFLQCHGLVIAVPGAAVQCPVRGLLPLAAGAVGAFAGGALGGGGHADRAVAQAGDDFGQGRQRLGAGQLQRHRVGRGLRHGSGDDEVVDIHSHGLSP